MNERLAYAGVILTVAIVCSGLGWLSWVQFENEAVSTVRAEEVHTFSPTAPLSTIVENVPPTETPTPGIDFAATINALAVEQRNYDATKTQEAVEAGNLATATQLAHNARINDAQYGNAIAEVEHESEMRQVELDIQSAAITHTLEMNAAELQAYQVKLDWKNRIELVKIGAWACMPIVLVCGGIFEVFRRMWLVKPEAVEYEQQPIQLEVRQGSRTRFSTLNLEEHKLHRWAQAALDGVGLSYGVWVETQKVFTRHEYDTLLSFMREENIIEYRDANNPAQGQQVTRGGAAALRHILRGE